MSAPPSGSEVPPSSSVSEDVAPTSMPAPPAAASGASGGVEIVAVSTNPVQPTAADGPQVQPPASSEEGIVVAPPDGDASALAAALAPCCGAVDAFINTVPMSQEEAHLLPAWHCPLCDSHGFTDVVTVLEHLQFHDIHAVSSQGTPRFEMPVPSLSSNIVAAAAAAASTTTSDTPTESYQKQFGHTIPVKMSDQHLLEAWHCPACSQSGFKIPLLALEHLQLHDTHATGTSAPAQGVTLS